MEAVSEFRYLGRLLTAKYDDWPEVVGNIRKTWVRWGRLARVLGREGADPKVSRSFLHCRDTACPPLRGGDVGTHKEDGVSPGRLPGQGCGAVNRETAPPGEGWGMVRPVPGRGDVGGGDRAD